MSIKSGVYQIRLITDGRIYIGSAHDIEARWKWHRGSTIQLIGKMIKKYGVENFEFTILEECEPTKEVLENREQYYLNLLQPFPWNENRGFNLAPTAYTPLGIKRSDETRAKLRASWHQNRGPEYFAQLSENVKGDKNPAKRPEVRAKISEAIQGRTWSQDLDRVKAHVERVTGRKQSDHWHARMKEVHQGAKRSEETKKKLSDCQQRTYKVISPDGAEQLLTTIELKRLCADNGYSYSNMQATSKSGKTYKGWRCELLSNKPF